MPFIHRLRKSNNGQFEPTEAPIFPNLPVGDRPPHREPKAVGRFRQDQGDGIIIERTLFDDGERLPGGIPVLKMSRLDE